MFTLLGKRDQAALLFHGLWHVYYVSVTVCLIFLGVIGWLCSVIVALPGRLLYYFIAICAN